MSNYTFGVSTWIWISPFSTATLSLFEKIKQMGFDAVEIPIEDPEIIDIQKVKEALIAYELQPIVCGAFGPTRDFTHEDLAIQENALNYIETCLELCLAWGAEFVAGPMYAATGKARLLPPEEKKREWELSVRNIYKASQMAESRGLKLAIEPLNRFETDMVNTSKRMIQMLKDVNHPAANVMLDGFHMNIEEKNISEAIKTVGERLIHVQVSENYRGTPGTGQTDWQGLKAGLSAINYQGCVSIEGFTPEVKELAGAVCIWEKLVEDQDVFASDGLKFLRELLL